MNPGLSITRRNALAITAEGTLVLFTEETRSQLYRQAMGKAAMAQGIQAMAAAAIDTGEFELNAELIEFGASELAAALKDLAFAIGQMKVQPAA